VDFFSRLELWHGVDGVDTVDSVASGGGIGRTARFETLESMCGFFATLGRLFEAGEGPGGGDGTISIQSETVHMPPGEDDN